MKKTVKVLSLLFVSVMFAFQSLSTTLKEIKIKLVASIAHAVSSKKTVKVYIIDKNFLDISNLKRFDHVIFVKNCFKADIIITNDTDLIEKGCKDKPIFITDYDAYKKSYKISIGALFWQKGRPVLVFNKNVLKRKHIHLSKGFLRYLK